MKKLLLLLLIVPMVCLGQTATYFNDGMLTIEIPTKIDIINGYPNADDINSEAIGYYNKGTEILMKPERESIKNAINYFINAINVDYKFIQAYDNLGKAYRMIEKYDDAIKTYELSLKIFPSGISAHQNLAVVYEKQKSWDKAIYEYKILINLDPLNPEGYYGLANVYKKTSRLNLALSNALKALELYKQNPTNYIGDAYGQIGLIYYDLGNKQKAKTYIVIAKEKHIANNLEDYFYDTFPKSLINELSIK